MFVQRRFSQGSRILLLSVLILTALVCRAAIPVWNLDVDFQNAGLLGAVNGSLFYWGGGSNPGGIVRWPPAVEGDPNETIVIVDSGTAGGGFIRGYDLYVVGPTSAHNDVSGMVSLHGVMKINLRTLEITDPVSAAPSNGADQIVVDHTGAIYIGAYYNSGYGTPHFDVNAFQKWSGSAWQGVGQGLDFQRNDSGVKALATDGTNIFVGGIFSGAKYSGTPVVSSNIVCWNPDLASFLAFPNYGLKSDNQNGDVHAFAVSGTNLFVGGYFTNQSVLDGGIARFSTVNLTSLPFGTLDYTVVSDITTLNGDAYIVGNFTHVTNGMSITAAVNAARWSAGSWSALDDGSGTDGVTDGGTGRLAANLNSVFFNSITDAGGQSTANGMARWQLSNEAPLRFTSGHIDSLTDAICTLAGLPGLDCEIGILDVAAGSWTTASHVVLDGFGAVTFQRPLLNGYGIFRTRAMEGAYHSTNAFGSIVTNFPSGYWLVGNPWQPHTTSELVPSPSVNDTRLYYGTNGATSGNIWTTATHNWLSQHTYGAGEGALLYNPGGGSLSYQTWGIFAENSFSRSCPTGYSLLAIPLIQPYGGGSVTQVDELNSAHKSGLSLLPAESSANPKSNVGRNDSGVINTYLSYQLTTGGQWQKNGSNSNVPLTLGEGFWFQNNFPYTTNWTNYIQIW